MAETNEPQPTERSAIEQRRDTLFELLEQGYTRIERGLDEGRNVAAWEDIWIALLNEYETVCEELQRDLAV